MLKRWFGDLFTPRRSRPAIVVGTLFLVIVVLLLIITTWLIDDAATFIAVLRIMFNWPVLVSAIALIAFLMFSEEIAFVIRNVKRLAAGGITADVGQPEPPVDERGPHLQIPSKDETPERQITDRDEFALDVQEEEIVHVDEAGKLSGEVLHWFHRFLVLFLTPVTIDTLKQIAVLEFVGEHYVGSGEIPDDFQFPEDNSIRLYLSGGQVHSTNRRTFNQAINALAQYELVRRGTLPTVTERGTEFLRFLGSKEGQELSALAAERFWRFSGY